MSQRHLIVIEGGGTSNYSAYSPDVPGAAATGSSREGCEREMRDAIGFHLDGLRAAGEPVPVPSSTATYVDV